MDIHNNARLTPHSRAELVRRVLTDGRRPRLGRRCDGRYPRMRRASGSNSGSVTRRAGRRSPRISTA